jgi:multiple sugar transport system substrate-binding protein
MASNRNRARVRWWGVIFMSGIFVVAPACVSNGPASSPAAPATVTAVPQPPPLAPVELHIYTEGAYTAEMITALAQGYTQRHSDVKLSFHQFSNYPDREVPDLVKAGRPPDLIALEDGALPYLVESGLVLNLREFMAADPSFSLDGAGIQEKTMQFGQVQGKPDLYAIPVVIDSLALYYNKDLFKQSGAPEPSEAWGWDELIAACKKIQQASPAVTCLEMGTAWLWWYWYPWVRGNGGDVLSKDGGTSTLSAPQTLDALRRYTELWTKHHVAQSPNESQVECLKAQKCAVAFGSSGTIKSAAAQWPFAWGVQQMPSFGQARAATYTTWGFAIGKQALHRQEAWEFLKALLAPEAQQQAVASGLGLPVLKAGVSLPEADSVFAKQMEYAVRVPDYPNVCGNPFFGDVQSLTQNAIENAIKGYAKLEDSLKQADSKINQCLAGAK